MTPKNCPNPQRNAVIQIHNSSTEVAACLIVPQAINGPALENSQWSINLEDDTNAQGNISPPEVTTSRELTQNYHLRNV